MRVIRIFSAILLCGIGMLSLCLLHLNFEVIEDYRGAPHSEHAARALGYTGGIPYVKEMEEQNMRLSLLQQRSFYANKDIISKRFSDDLLYSTSSWKWADKWYAVILNDSFAFRHIFKNGGTTMEIQTGTSHANKKALKGLHMVAAVRDPIDHFLSGWQECGERFPSFMESEKTEDTEYDGRIRKWLERVKYFAFEKPLCPKRCTCAMHSFPQSNFLLTKKMVINPMIVLVGDLQELPGLVNLVGFEYDHSKGSGRNATATAFKEKHFPKKKHLISAQTMKEICDFLGIDFFLFDFELPEECRKAN